MRLQCLLMKSKLKDYSVFVQPLLQPAYKSRLSRKPDITGAYLALKSVLKGGRQFPRMLRTILVDSDC